MGREICSLLMRAGLHCEGMMRYVYVPQGRHTCYGLLSHVEQMIDLRVLVLYVSRKRSPSIEPSKDPHQPHSLPSNSPK